MLEYLSAWEGGVTVGDAEFSSVSAITTPLPRGVHIILTPAGKAATQAKCDNPAVPVDEPTQYVIEVKQYMTKPASPAFDFMERWNHNQPMPLRTMVGEKIKETSGMVYMKLHGDITARVMCTCLRCGRPLTNPVSQYFGLGSECGNHGYVNPFNTDEELEAAVASFRKEYLQTITWEGWIIKSAITRCEPFENNLQKM